MLRVDHIVFVEENSGCWYRLNGEIIKYEVERVERCLIYISSISHVPLIVFIAFIWILVHSAKMAPFPPPLHGNSPLDWSPHRQSRRKAAVTCLVEMRSADGRETKKRDRVLREAPPRTIKSKRRKRCPLPFRWGALVVHHFPNTRKRLKTRRSWTLGSAPPHEATTSAMRGGFPPDDPPTQSCQAPRPGEIFLSQRVFQSIGVKITTILTLLLKQSRILTTCKSVHMARRFHANQILLFKVTHR